ncbi:venom dipeptidyl peptidase 4-like isoform X2 [Sipha flava]|uniref:Venom dipeptidyl peptidase 4 n=1 Tax=Sipha flava TaxID=143950 RepID=A0A8B8GR50_9HEMI|nr:venom dipeptidyl peptidase 4-like isoform X2 [Sipha flava]
MGTFARKKRIDSDRGGGNTVQTTPGQLVSDFEKCIWNVKHRPLVFLLILILISSIICALIYSETNTFYKPEARTLAPLEFQNLMKGDYEPNRFNGTWISDDEILMKDAYKNIVLFNVNSSDITVLANNLTRNIDKVFQYDLSADKEYLLLAYHYRKVYRHSFIAHYDCIVIKTGEQFTLQTNGQPWNLQLAKWSPTGHGLAIVELNEVYYIHDVSNFTNMLQFSITGSFGSYNGIPDWVYEEEIFSSNSAMWFSKQGSYIAYASFNDTQVPTMQIPLYGVPGNLKYQYTKIVGVHYPKVGVPNPIVQLFVESIKKSISKPIPVDPPTELTSVSTDIILNTVVWSDDTNLFVIWMNRVQNTSYLVHYLVTEDFAENKMVVTFSQRGGWLDFTQIPLVDDKNRLAIIYPVQQFDGDMFKHIVIVESDSHLVPLTSGKFEVIELLKWDIQSNYIYYLANKEENPEEQYLYRTQVKENSIPECLSCKESCKFSKAEMSTENSHYALLCLGPNIPEVKIFKTTGEKILDWEMNTEVKYMLSTISLPRISFIDVPIAGTKFSARVRLIIPPSLDQISDVKYPMLVNTYAGPGSNLALNKFAVEWNTYFSSSNNVVIAQIDGRGSGRKGNNMLFANYRKLGTYEIEDQIYVASYLQDHFSFIDKSKTAIWGWSYGGYTTGMVLTKDNNNIFKCGLSVAPVTDWIYYDTIYTERYMGLLSDNMDNYKNASLLTHAEKFRNKKYMVIHGTYDDNVHYQQSMMLSYELERRVILFRQQSYPDESHGLSSVRNHVYQTISAFLLDCFHDKL